MMKKLLLLFTLVYGFGPNIQAQVNANAGPDLEICFLDTLKMTGSGLQTGDTGTYQWKDLVYGNVLANTANLTLRMNNPSTRSFELRVQKTKNKITYTDYDTVQIAINALPTFTFAGLPTRCYNDGAIQLTKIPFVKAYSGDKTQATTDVRYFQRFKSPSWITGGPVGADPYVYDYPKYISNSSVPKIGFRDTICYDYTDYKACYNKECKPIKINPNPIVDLVNQDVCMRKCSVLLNPLALKPFSKVGGIQTFVCIGVPSQSSIDPSSVISINNSVTPPNATLNIQGAFLASSNRKYTIEYQFKDAITGCSGFDTAEIHVLADERNYLKPSPKACINQGEVFLDSFVHDSATGQTLYGGYWKVLSFNGSRDRSNPSIARKLDSSVSGGHVFHPIVGAGTYCIRYSDTSRCALDDSLYLIVNGLPIVQINAQDTICAADSFLALQNIKPIGPYGDWSGPGVVGRQFHTSISPQTALYHSFKVQYNYTHPLTQCSSGDSLDIVVQSTPIVHYVVQELANSRYDVWLGTDSVSMLDNFKLKTRWIFSNGDTTDGATGMAHFDDTGSYYAVVSSESGLCRVSDTIYFRITGRVSSVGELQNASSIKLFPNPAHDELNIRSMSSGLVNIYDVNGRKLIQAEIQANADLKLNIQSLFSGLYILELRIGSSVTQQKLIVE